MLFYLERKRLFAYIDDVIIYSKEIHQPLVDIEGVLKLLHQAEGTQKLIKDHFFLKKVEYLGLTILFGCLAASSKNVYIIKYAVLRHTAYK